MNALTARQAECLAFIKARIDALGAPPTIREIGHEMGIDSTNGVSDHLRALERKGFIALPSDGTSRSIRLRAGGRLVPDAFAIDDASMCMTFWEICNHQHLLAAEEKWDGLTVALDGFDEWSLTIVTVDARGICQAVRGDASAVWLVDAACPFPMCPPAKWTRRAANGGTDIALAAALSHILQPVEDES